MTHWLSHGLQDAYLLGRLLSSPLLTRATIPHALKAYDAVRRPRGNAAHTKSFDTGALCNLTTPDGRDDMDAVATMIRDNKRLWFVLGDVEPDVQEALAILHDSVAADSNTQPEPVAPESDVGKVPVGPATVFEASVPAQLVT